MTRILALYYSMYGHVETMAQSVAEGLAALMASRSPSNACRS